MSDPHPIKVKKSPGIIGMLVEALPTIAYFSSLSLGVAQSLASLAIAVLAAGVIWLERRRGVRQDAIWLGCNLHFLLAGPLLWALFLTGQRALAGQLLDWVLFGVPLMVTLVLVVRASQTRTRAAMLLAAIALAALGYAAADPSNYVHVIALPLAVIFWAGLLLRWKGGLAGVVPLMLASLGLDEVTAS